MVTCQRNMGRARLAARIVAIAALLWSSLVASAVAASVEETVADSKKVRHHHCVHEEKAQRFEDSVDQDSLTIPQLIMPLESPSQQEVNSFLEAVGAKRNLRSVLSERSLAASALTTSFQPIRIAFDLSKLDSDPGSACTREGEIVQVDDASYTCTSGDVLMADKREFITTVLLKVIRDYFESTLSVKRVVGNLVIKGIGCSTTDDWACCGNSVPSNYKKMPPELHSLFDMRVCVHLALAAPTAEESNKASAGVGVKCVVGKVIQVPDSAQEAAGANDRVLWVQGGALHDPVRLESDGSGDCRWIEVPVSEVRRIPQSLDGNVALLVNDMAVAIHAARIVVERKSTTIAIMATSAVTPLVHLLVWCLQQASDSLQIPHIHVKMLNAVSIDEGLLPGPLATILHPGICDDNVLRLDCCIDLCCTEASLDFATRQLEPLGTLVLLASNPCAKTSSGSTAVNMNTVVVNELHLISVGDFQDEIGEAIEVLTTHAAEFTSIAQHSADSGRILVA